jgi:1-acylglycerone phosphate reductase
MHTRHINVQFNVRTTPWDGLYDASKAAVHSLSETLFMECKPFNVNVVLVAPGFTVSNMSQNSIDSMHIPENTLYKNELGIIMDRVKRIASDDAMPLDQFANQVVDHVLKPKPAFYLTLGGQASSARLVWFLPSEWRLNYVWKFFGGK